MKTFALLLFCFFNHTSSAQYISGLYAGTLINDSTGKEQQYELALSEYRGQITGYAYTTFIVRDSFYYSVKRIKAVRKEGKLEIEDVKILAHNFPQPPNKGVRQITNFSLPQEDTASAFNGTWRTTQTKHFYAIGGQAHLQRNGDSSGSALMAHLYETGKRPNNTVITSATRTNEIANNKISATTPEPASMLTYSQRKTTLIQTLAVTSDSVTVSFYDNGVVDGDTISVYLDEANIISKTKLTAVAVKQTIILRNDKSSQRLILAAENLGTIPPNTGLLVVQDGGKRHQIHFTADLQTNAAIELKKPVKLESQ